MPKVILTLFVYLLSVILTLKAIGASRWMFSGVKKAVLLACVLQVFIYLFI